MRPFARYSIHDERALLVYSPYRERLQSMLDTILRTYMFIFKWNLKQTCEVITESAELTPRPQHSTRLIRGGRPRFWRCRSEPSASIASIALVREAVSGSDWPPSIPRARSALLNPICSCKNTSGSCAILLPAFLHDRRSVRSFFLPPAYRCNTLGTRHAS